MNSVKTLSKSTPALTTKKPAATRGAGEKITGAKADAWAARRVSRAGKPGAQSVAKLTGAKTASDIEKWFSGKYGSVESIKADKVKLTAAYNEVRDFIDGRNYEGPEKLAYVRALKLDAELKRYLR